MPSHDRLRSDSVCNASAGRSTISSMAVVICGANPVCMAYCLQIVGRQMTFSQLVPQTTVSPKSLVPQTTVSASSLVPQTTVSPSSVVPQTTVSPSLAPVTAASDHGRSQSAPAHTVPQTTFLSFASDIDQAPTGSSQLVVKHAMPHSTI